MTDLMEELFVYARENRIKGYLCKDPDYSSALCCSEKQLTKLQEQLSPQQSSRLNSFLNERDLVFFCELRAIFQAGFSMGMELSR